MIKMTNKTDRELIKDLASAINKDLKNIYKRLDTLEEDMSINNELIDGLCDDVDCILDSYEEDDLDIGDIKEFDGYSYEDEIKDFVESNYGLSSYTVGNGEGAALLIPLDSEYCKKELFEKVKDFLKELLND